MTAQAAAEYRNVRRKSPPALAEIAAVVSSIRALSLAPYLLHISEREDSLLYDIENKFAE